MFYLRDIPVDRWLKKYPALADDGGLGPACECEQPDIIPWRSNKSVGLVCMSCNSSTWMRTTAEGNRKLLELVSNFIGVSDG